MIIALSILAFTLLLALGLSMRSARSGMNLEQWSVGGRGFGTLLAVSVV